jgi:hypothetical protein
VEIVGNYESKELNRLMGLFEKSFINQRNELILEPKKNVYFRLDNINNDLELKCKVLEFVSRYCIKGSNKYWYRYFTERLNEFLHNDFDKIDLEIIYTRLGNNCNRKLCIEFIESGYDFEVFPNHEQLRTRIEEII